MKLLLLILVKKDQPATVTVITESVREKKHQGSVGR